MSLTPTDSALRLENAGLRARLEEAEATLRAIRSGEVDAITVNTPRGEQIYTLQGADEPYRVMVETMGDGAVTITPDGLILYCNRRFAELVEADLQQVIGSPVQRFLGSGEADKFAVLTQQARVNVAGGRINLLRSNGTGVPTHVVLRSLRIGDTPNVVVIVTDLTEFATAQEKLTARYRERELQFQESLSTFSTQIGTAEFVNTIPENETPQALKILILEDQPMDAELMQRELRKAGLDFTATRVANRADFIAALEALAPDIVLADYKLPDFNGAEALAHVRDVHPEIPVVMVTGTLGDEAAIALLNAGAKDYVLKSNLLRLPSAVERAIAVEQGIRARKSAERALRASNALLQTAERIGHIGGFDWEIASGAIVWSEETYRMFGLSPGEFIPTLAGFAECVHPDDRGRVHEAINASVTRNEPFDAEFRILRPDKVERAIHSRGEIDRDETGKAIRIIGTSHDITDRKRAEEDLRSSEERFRLVVEHAPDAILLYDVEQDRLISANKAAERLFGCAREEIVKHGPRHFYVPEQPDARPVTQSFEEHNASALAGAELLYERRILNGLGQERLCRVTLVQMPSANPRLLRASFVDITDQKAAERALLRLNRTLRTLSRGNEALVRTTSEPELLRETCRTVVEAGGYRMAWIGLAQHDAAKSVIPVASAGDVGDYLDKAQITWADEPRGRGPTGRAVRSGELLASRSFATDPCQAPWHDAAKKRGFASSVSLPLKDGSGVFAALTIYSGDDAFDDDELKLLQELASNLAFGIRSLREHVAHEALNQRWKASLEATVGAIANTVEMRDPYTAGHQQRVARLAVAMAHELGLPENQVRGLYLAGIIHDVGKINIPSDILNRPGRLSKLQYQLIQGHAQAGNDIIKGVDFPWPIAQMVLQHHERLDGSGYPQGLKGDAILVEAKILALADVVEAMMSHRPYRAALGIDAALAEIEQGKGRLYDPAAVEACVALFRHKGFGFG